MGAKRHLAIALRPGVLGYNLIVCYTMPNKAIYAASFDPVTNGHVWIIEQGARLFDELVVAIGTNPEKHYTFSIQERLTFLRATTVSMNNVTIDVFENQYLVKYAKAMQASYIIRGIRTEGDYEYERRMRYLNSDLDPDITTIFLIPPREIAEISSSAVKGLVGPEGWEYAVARYLPVAVYEAFVFRFGGSRSVIG